MLHYAGIGSRKTPSKILDNMTQIARALNHSDWYLHSGGADGADTAFASGHNYGNKTIFLPWPRYNGLQDTDCIVIDQSHNSPYEQIASSVHPAWHRCSQGARKLHARNSAIILGATLTAPVAAVICWTQDGEASGGTGLSIRIARKHNIPVYNLFLMDVPTVLEHMDRIKTSHRPA